MSNVVLVDSFMKTIEHPPYKLMNGNNNKMWLRYDSNLYNVKLYRFATGTEQQRHGVTF
jgi:hypothetical protein